MEIIRGVAEMAARAADYRDRGLRSALVPTMGYFHEGHLSLLRRARADNDVVTVSLFVNPAQFGPREDLNRYPRDFDRDRSLAEAAGVDVLFAPAPEDVYPPGYATYVEVERLGDVLCGASRPKHFRGVATVVAKLFNICRPAVAYFGRKDYQQTVVIKRLARDLDFDLAVEVLPIVREPDGLAMSSRNSYLSPDERRRATCLFAALNRAQGLFAAGERRPGVYEETAATIIAEAGARLDYAAAVDPEDLTPVPMVAPGTVLGVAAFVGHTRLIDNTLIGNDDLTSR